MSQASSDDFLIDLFREEVRTNAQKLTDGLVAIEQDTASGERLEAMMRAAHSIKGAARVVNVQPAVELAHAMEDCLVRAQNDPSTLTSEVVDVLLAGVDALLAIGEAAGTGFSQWQQREGPAVACLVTRLQKIVREGPPSPGAWPLPIGEPLPMPSTADDNRQEDDPSVQSRSATDAAASTATGAPPADHARPSAEIPSEAIGPSARSLPVEEGIVRVSASSLTRLMGLAGESLCESRWLQPFAKSLAHLKRLHNQIADDLDALRDSMETGESPQRTAARAAAAFERLGACRAMLSDRIEEFDRRLRHSDDLSTRLYREVISSRMRPFRDGVQGLPRMVRDLARQLGKLARLEIQGETTEVDRDILEKLDAPLNHLLRNALDHGMEKPDQRRAAGKPETGLLRVTAVHTAGMLSIEVSDDGRGIDIEQLRRKIVDRGHTTNEVAQRLNEVELLEFLFLPGFSTAPGVTEVSGRGVGLDVVHTMAHAVGGRVHVHSRIGNGTTFHLELPVTLSVLRAVIVEIAGEPYAMPHNRVDRVVRLPADQIRSLENRQYFQLDGKNVGLMLARQVFHLEPPVAASDDLCVVLFGNRSATYGVVVDRFLGEQDLVIRPLDPRLGKVPGIHAAAILDDGSPVLIVDLDDFRCSIERLLHQTLPQRTDTQDLRLVPHRRKRILVVDDSITVREVERQLLANQGYSVEVAADGMAGWNALSQEPFDLVITDIDMPRLNGLELVRKMKSDARLQSIPVVIVSYKDRDDDRLRGLEAGANYYLTKSSFHDDSLIQAVRELIGDAQA